MAAVAETTFPIAWCRSQFPALERQLDGQRVVYLDGPAGSQTPQCVIDAVSRYLIEMNANHGGLFDSSRESDAMLAAAHQAAADLLGVNSPECTVFGANMTSLTFALSRSLARTWQPGDEVIVTRLDHDANVSPWVLAARDAGAQVRLLDFQPNDCTLDVEQLRGLLSSAPGWWPRLRVERGGHDQPGAKQCARPRTTSAALVFLDAVHYAPHALIDVARLELRFSGLLRLQVLRPARRTAVGAARIAGRPRGLQGSARGRFSAGKVDDRHPEPRRHQRHAGGDRVPGRLGAPRGAACADRRTALVAAMAEIGAYERQLCRQLLAALSELPSVRVWGITDPARLDERVPTVSITHRKLSPAALAEYLGSRGIFAWHGNFYALQVTESLGLEPAGLVRLGLLHYNTPAEVQRLAAVLRELE